METETFLIRSLAIQNLIMGVAVTIIAGLLVRAIGQRNLRHAVAVILWAVIALWFFNSPLWGFSAITAGPAGLKLDYGFLSIYKNTTLPPATSWKIHIYLGGLRKTTPLYFLQVADHRSLKVHGRTGLETLKPIGAAIDRLNGSIMGGTENIPVNR